MYSKAVIARHAHRYQQNTGRILKRHTLRDCRRNVDHFDSLLLEDGTLDPKQRPAGLTPKEKAYIRNEIALCRLDFVYWLSRYVFIAHKETGQLVLFQPNTAQRIVLSLWADMEERGLAIAFLSIKARQLGISTLSEMTVAHRVQFRPNINAIIGSSDPEKSKLMSHMMEICWDNQPWWMVPQMTARRAGTLFEFGNQNSAVSIQHGTQFSGIARGTTTNCVHLSELADFDNPTELIDASLMGAAHESPHLFLALESTAKGRDNWVHDNWRNSKENWPRTLLRPIFLPWYVADDMYPPATFLKRNPVPTDWEPKGATAKCAETARLYVRNYEPVRKHLGDDWQMSREQQWWWECKREEARVKRQLGAFLSETPGNDNEAFQSTNASAFDPEHVEELRTNTLSTEPFVFAFTGTAVSERMYPDKRDILQDADHPAIPVRARWRPDIPPIDFSLVPLRFESYQEDPNGRLYIWEFPQAGANYVIGTDTSDGIGQDRSVLQVIRLRDPYDPNDLDRQVAEYASAYVNARDLWPLSLCLGTYYSTPSSTGKIEQIRQVIECNGNGESVQYELQKLGWWNFHPWMHYDNKRPAKNNKIGWFTNVRTRSMAVDCIVTALRDEWLIIRSPWFVEEMSSFERDEFKQSLRAGYGAHDDRVMSMAFALFSSYVNEITTDGRSFFTSRKRMPGAGPALSGVRPETLTNQLIKEMGVQRDPYQTGKYNPY